MVKAPTTTTQRKVTRLEATFRKQLLGVRGLATQWQVRRLLYSSERFNPALSGKGTPATRIQCFPRAS
jgi:hypothetical protein